MEATTISSFEYRSTGSSDDAEDQEERKLKCFHCPSTTKSKRKLRQHILNEHSDTSPRKSSLQPTGSTSLVKNDVNCRPLFGRISPSSASPKPENSVLQQPSLLDVTGVSSANGDLAVLAPAATSHNSSLPANRYSTTKQHHCTYCGYLAVSAGKLAVHVRTHTGEKPFVCSFCEYACSHKSGLNAHTRKYHTGENLHSCPHCSYKSLRPGHLERHIRKHTGEKPFSCSMCEASFTCTDYLNDHVRDFHNKERLFACPFCNKKMSRPGYFEAHLRTHAKKPDAVIIDSMDIPQKSISTLLTSFECSIETPSTEELNTNLPESSSDLGLIAPSENEKAADGLFSCTLCEFKCSVPQDLKVHVRTHKTIRPYKCPICPFSCKLPDKLQVHIAIHTGDKPFHCPHCDAKFTLQSRLNQHVIIHDEGKKIKCPECDYVCFRNTDLRKHMPKHTGEKNYTCPACFKNFASSSSVRSHMRHVHNLPQVVPVFKIRPHFTQEGIKQLQ